MSAKLYLWRAWTAGGYIADCGTAWAASEPDATSIASMSLGGPYAGEVVRFEVVPVCWPVAPHGRQVTSVADVHMGKKNPRTARFGDSETPIADLMTECRSEWPTDGPRPRRTLRPDLVTCLACLAIVRAELEDDPPDPAG